MYEVTIAIPLYNTEDYIRKTMESVLNQTFQCIEILIIDDLGTDGSIDIIRELQKRHPRGKDIRIVSHQQNMGVAMARNTAIKEAHGRYIYFMDSDDTITPNCIQLLYDIAEKSHAQLTVGSHRIVTMDGRIEREWILPTVILRGKETLIQYKYAQIKLTTPLSMWNILIDLHFLREHRLQFKKFKVGEDAVFNLDMQLLVESCAMLPDITYNYLKRANSLSQFNARNHITLEEVRGQFALKQYSKNKFIEIKSRPYADVYVTRIMTDCFYAALSTVKKRKIIHPSVPDKEMKEMLMHPLTLLEVCRMKKHSMLNLAFYSLGKLPYRLTVCFLIGYLKIKK